MEPGAATPEELETLVEDALVMGDADALVRLLEPGALVAANRREWRGPDAVRAAGADGRDEIGAFVAAPRRVMQTADLALVLGSGSITVSRRAGDRTWRLAIALLDPDHDHEEDLT